jgi:hypothetical protein
MSRRKTPPSFDPLAAVIPIAGDAAPSAKAPARVTTPAPAVAKAPEPEPEPAPEPEPVIAAKPEPAAAPKPAVEKEPQPVVAQEPEPEPAAPTANKSNAKPKRSKVRATFNIDPKLYDEVRDAVVALSGPETQLSLVGFFEEACRREVQRLSKLHNEGKKFPKRKTALPGRRLLS